MALEDRGLDTEQYTEFENLSPYSTTSAYSDTPTYYHTEYDWQQQQQQHQQLHQPHAMIGSERQYYTYQPTPEVSSHTYLPYHHHPGVEGSDMYHTSSMWTPNSAEPLPSGAVHTTHRFFSGIDLSQQTRGPQTMAGSGPSGKPKRKRVQSLTQRKAANVRERRRMFHLNEAFDELRKRLPAFNYEKRLSRIETLRLAMTYISFMKDVSVGRDPKSVKLKAHSSELDGSPLSFSEDLLGQGSYGESDSRGGEDSDCSNDEGSNHSGGN